MKAPLEKDVQAACLQYLAAIGAFATRVNSGAVKVEKRFVRFNSEPGCADILACVAGRFWSIEVKRPGRDTTSAARKLLQAAHRARVENAGGIAVVVRSAAELQAALVAAGH